MGAIFEGTTIMGASPDKAKKRAPFRFSRPDGSRGDYQELAALEVILKDLKQAIESAGSTGEENRQGIFAIAHVLKGGIDGRVEMREVIIDPFHDGLVEVLLEILGFHAFLILPGDDRRIVGDSPIIVAEAAFKPFRGIEGYT